MGLLNASLPAFLSSHAPGAGGYGAAIAAGLICGEFLSGRVGGLVVTRVPALGFVVSAAAVSVAAASAVPATMLLMLFVLRVGDGTTETAYDTVVQTQTPQNLLGRVFALAGAVQQTGWSWASSQPRSFSARWRMPHSQRAALRSAGPPVSRCSWSERGGIRESSRSSP